MRLSLIVASMSFAISGATSAQTRASDQLDFLGGNWSIHDAGGGAIGNSRIVVQAPGAMIYEERRVGSDAVQPLWFENSERNQGWSQLFVGPAGRTREFRTLSPADTWPLVMGGDVVLRDGTPARFRLTMTRASTEESRRVLEISRDQGATWNVLFDYNYRRTPAS